MIKRNRVGYTKGRTNQLRTNNIPPILIFRTDRNTNIVQSVRKRSEIMCVGSLDPPSYIIPSLGLLPEGLIPKKGFTSLRKQSQACIMPVNRLGDSGDFD